MTSVPATESLPLEAPRAGWYTHHWNRAGLYRLAARAATTMPRPARLALARGVGTVAYHRLSTERAVVTSNLSRALPHATGAARDGTVREVFRRFAMCFADLVSANRTSAARLLARVEGEDALKAVLGDGKGAIVVTAHLGNWELSGRLLATRMTRPTHVVVAAEADPDLERFLRDAGAPVRFVTRTRPTDVLQLVAALRRGEVVAVQGDRALGERSDARTRFFGAPASFPLGPFVLARATGAPVVPAFCSLGRDRRYVISLGEPRRVAAGEEGIALDTWVEALEGAVTAHPEQWFNFFDVWRDPLRG